VVPPRKCQRGRSKYQRTEGAKRKYGTLHASCATGNLNNRPSDPNKFISNALGTCPVTRTFQDLLDSKPASPEVNTFHGADSDFCSCWVADAKDLSNYGDTVLRIRKLRIGLLWFFFDGRCFSWFTLALAFDIKRVNQPILIKLLSTSPTLKLRLSGTSHRRFFQERMTTYHNYRINCTIRSDGEDQIYIARYACRPCHWRINWLDEFSEVNAVLGTVCDGKALGSTGFVRNQKGHAQSHR
jgi:hypothetical protein